MCFQGSLISIQLPYKCACVHKMYNYQCQWEESLILFCNSKNLVLLPNTG